MPKTKTIRVKTKGHALCLRCGKRPEWTRERVRQHVVNTGHSVRFVIEDITIYEPLEADRG